MTIDVIIKKQIYCLSLRYDHLNQKTKAKRSETLFLERKWNIRKSFGYFTNFGMIYELNSDIKKLETFCL